MDDIILSAYDDRKGKEASFVRSQGLNEPLAM